MLASEVDELPRALDDGAAVGRAGDGDAAPAPELEQPSSRSSRSARSTVFVLTPRIAARSFRRWGAFAQPCFTDGDRTAVFAGDLLVEAPTA